MFKSSGIILLHVNKNNSFGLIFLQKKMGGTPSLK